jgi:hypothetical protein
VVILGEHQFSILQYRLSIRFVIGANVVLVTNLTHHFECLFNFCLKLCLFGWILRLFVNGLDNTEIEFVEIDREHWIGSCEIIPRYLEGALLGDYLHIGFIE